jgi:hypothetical protein
VHQSRTCSAACPLDVVDTESRLRLGDLVEALDRELPAVADLAVRLAIDLEVDQDIITLGLLIASAFPPAPARGAALPPPAGSASAGRQRASRTSVPTARRSGA